MGTRHFQERINWRERFEYLVEYLSENYERSITDLSNYEGDDFQESIIEIAIEIDRRLIQAKDKVFDFVDLKSSSQNEEATCPVCGSQAKWKDDEDGKETPDGGSYYCPLGCKVKG